MGNRKEDKSRKPLTTWQRQENWLKEELASYKLCEEKEWQIMERKKKKSRIMILLVYDVNDTPLYIHISHICTYIYIFTYAYTYIYYIYISSHISINRHVFLTFFFFSNGSTHFLETLESPDPSLDPPHSSLITWRRRKRNGAAKWWVKPPGVGVGWCHFFWLVLLLLLLLFCFFSTNCGEVSVCVVDVGWCWLMLVVGYLNICTWDMVKVSNWSFRGEVLGCKRYWDEICGVWLHMSLIRLEAKQAIDSLGG